MCTPLVCVCIHIVRILMNGRRSLRSSQTIVRVRRSKRRGRVQNTSTISHLSGRTSSESSGPSTLTHLSVSSGSPDPPEEKKRSLTTKRVRNTGKLTVADPKKRRLTSSKSSRRVRNAREATVVEPTSRSTTSTLKSAARRGVKNSGQTIVRASRSGSSRTDIGMPDTDGNVEGDSKQSTEHPDAGGYLEPAGDMSRKENEIESVSRHRKRCRSNPASESPVKKVCREVSRTQDLLALLEEDALKANSTLRLYDRITEDVLSLHAQDAPRSRLTRQALVRACSWIPALIQFDEGGQETCVGCDSRMKGSSCILFITLPRMRTRRSPST